MAVNLARRGLWLLPIGGALTFLVWVFVFVARSPDPVKDPTGYAHAATNPAKILVGDVQLIAAFCILIGLLALYVALADTPGGSWLAVGALAGTVSMALVIGFAMIITLADAVVGDVVLSGHPDAGQTYQWMTGGHWNGRVIPFLVVGGVAGLIAAVGLAVGTWRSGRYAKWIPIVFTIAWIVEAVWSPPSIIGGLLLAIVGFFIARAGTTMEITRSGRPGTAPIPEM